MSVEVPETSCAQCGIPLRGEYADRPGAERPPCPNCGSTVRSFGKAQGATILPTSMPPVARDLDQIVDQIAEADPGDVQQVASGQIRLLINYYGTALGQAQRSFTWALVAAGVGLAFLLAAVVFLLVTPFQPVAVVSVISGALVEVIAGVNFILYSKTTAQLAAYHNRLDQTQRFLLANSICESLEGEVKNTTRAALVAKIANQAQTSDPQ
jgi:hypothetical protein